MRAIIPLAITLVFVSCSRIAPGTSNAPIAPDPAATGSQRSAPPSDDAQVVRAVTPEVADSGARSRPKHSPFSGKLAFEFVGGHSVACSQSFESNTTHHEFLLDVTPAGVVRLSVERNQSEMFGPSPGRYTKSAGSAGFRSTHKKLGVDTYEGRAEHSGASTTIVLKPASCASGSCPDKRLACVTDGATLINYEPRDGGYERITVDVPVVRCTSDGLLPKEANEPRDGGLLFSPPPGLTQTDIQGGMMSPSEKGLRRRP